MTRNTTLRFLAPALATALLAGGCASGTGGLGREAGTTHLPQGLTLMGSDAGQCAGTVHVGEESVVGEGLRGEFFVDPGENATYRLRGEGLEWACVLQGNRDFDQMQCPSRTTHVRVTRAAQGGEVLFECFG